MVGDLEKSQRAFPGNLELVFHSRADVSREQEFDVAIVQTEHQRVVIADFLTFPIGTRRMQYLDRDVPDVDAVPGLQPSPDRAAPGYRLTQHGPLDRSANRHGIPDLPHVERVNDRLCAADVIE